MNALEIQPAFGSEGIPIVFTCDDRYAAFVSVAVENILGFAARERSYDIIILNLGGESAVAKAITAQVAGLDNFSLRFFDLSETVAGYKLENMAVVKRFPREVILPVFIPLVCRRYAKVLALDADIALTSDVAELFDIDLGDSFVGAVIDYECTIETMLRKEKRPVAREYIWRRLGVKLFEFFNSGILSFNIAQIVKEGRIDDFAAAIPLIYRLPDQDVLNHACRGRVKFLPPVWNVQSFSYLNEKFQLLPEETRRLFLAFREQAKIMHYTYVIKPWFAAGCGFWWKFARKSPFHDLIVRDFLENRELNPFLKERKKPKRTFVLKMDPPRG